MHIDGIALHDVGLVRSNGTTGRTMVIEARAGDVSGWAEAAVGATPWSDAEFIDSAWIFASQFAAPLILGSPPAHPAGLDVLLEGLNGHPKTKMALELALWDLYARVHSFRMLDALGGGKDLLILRSELDITDTLEDLKQTASVAIERGAAVLHVAINPGWDEEPLGALRRRYPAARLIADAAGSYHPSELDHLRRLESLDLDGLIDPFSKAEDKHTASLVAQTDLDIWSGVSNWKELTEATNAGVNGVMVTADSFGGFRTLLDVVTHCSENSMHSLMTTRAATMLGAGQTVVLAAATGIDPGPMTHFFGRWGRDIVKPGWAPGKAGLRLPDGLGNGLTIDRPYLKRQALRSEVID